MNGQSIGPTKALYLEDAYIKEFDATILDIAPEGYILLDKTAFYPRGGGQPSDLGTIKNLKTKDHYVIQEVFKKEGKIFHKVDKPGLNIGDEIHGIIDWERRHVLMRYHTALHLINAVMYNNGEVLVTGNELGIDRSRMDLNLKEFNKERFQEYISKANELISKDAKVKNYTLSRDDAMKIPGVVKLAGALPPEIPNLRIVEIEGIDIEADGGTHVRSLKEIGQIELIDIENKGKDRKRMYIKVVP